MSLVRLGPQSQVLEVGPGIRQPTLPLARFGCRILGIKLGSQMAIVAQRSVSEFLQVDIIVSPFMDLPLPTEKFDLVVSANAFH